MTKTSWAGLAAELENIKALGSLYATWLAYEGSEDYGVWLLGPHGPELDERRARFGHFAALAVGKCGLDPSPLPTALQYCPHWATVCDAETAFAREMGKSLDLSDSAPFGLVTIDRDAVDPCTRAWLELLRRESQAFRITAYLTETIRGVKYPGLGARIEDVCTASIAYVNRRAREEIGARLIKSAAKSSAAKKKRGRPPTKERAVIRQEIMKYGDEWREHLGPICAELDRKQVPLGSFYGKPIDMDGEQTRIKKWSDLDLAQGAQRLRYLDTLRKCV
jgi:hypothetical protein